MTLHLWLTFSLAYLLTSLIPGPNVLLTVRNALRHGPSGIGMSLLGNLTAQLLAITAVAMGVGALLISLPTAFLALKLAGAGYLIYLGVRQLFLRNAPKLSATAPTPPAAQARWRIAMEAFLVSASNPKSLMFFVAFLPQFLEPGRSILTQFAAMYVSMAVIVCVVHSFYSFTAYRFGQQVKASTIAAWFKRASGALFIGLGIRLLNTKAV
ncbi:MULTISPECIES: LysE family translocator [unclassified Pseudomonas]|uniref:LysE family translocator n=1 Tax=unclassified Pseudomonas TaxID=196821 RepID=UPI00244BFE5B|nr:MULTISPECIES: LysE family translocator [unclassified Pseudomonas]MDH0303422.1 LysE family translocator [Pseudomonas sp. GD04091]MDH1984511.1 LysE family translocator [Pseudomonas sp. GD03689]